MGPALFAEHIQPIYQAQRRVPSLLRASELGMVPPMTWEQLLDRSDLALAEAWEAPGSSSDAASAALLSDPVQGELLGIAIGIPLSKADSWSEIAPAELWGRGIFQVIDVVTVLSARDKMLDRRLLGGLLRTRVERGTFFALLDGDDQCSRLDRWTDWERCESSTERVTGSGGPSELRIYVKKAD